jgi:coenzyme F420-reducing hydrogenase beta subunit
MNAHRLLPVGEQGPLKVSQELLKHLWQRANLNAILVPAWSGEDRIPEPTLLKDPSGIDRADPFAPFMPHNSAGRAIEALEQMGGRKLALAMRPCELLSFKEIALRKGLDLDQSILISTDCLSAFAPDDTEWRSEASSDTQRLTHEALRFASQGGILASRFRGSCQFCDQIIPQDIDVHIGVLGLETSKHMVLSIRDPELDRQLSSDLGLGVDVPGDIAQRRERVLKNITAWRKRTWEQAISNLDMDLATIKALSDHLLSCAHCRNRLQDHCPSFESNWLAFEADARLVEAANWVSSCGGCGTCEHECPENYPLFMVIWYLRKTSSVPV